MDRRRGESCGDESSAPLGHLIDVGQADRHVSIGAERVASFLRAKYAMQVSHLVLCECLAPDAHHSDIALERIGTRRCRLIEYARSVTTYGKPFGGRPLIQHTFLEGQPAAGSQFTIDIEFRRVILAVEDNNIVRIGISKAAAAHSGPLRLGISAVRLVAQSNGAEPDIALDVHIHAKAPASATSDGTRACGG